MDALNGRPVAAGLYNSASQADDAVNLYKEAVNQDVMAKGASERSQLMIAIATSQCIDLVSDVSTLQ